ncbi:MAG: uracil-DNA glycosylase [Chloroflexi bacterium]|nr:uracil-DNA glycosylase [Chloroflexota bacterium]
MSALSELAKQISVCTDCPLSRGRTKAVPGEGPEHVDALFIGEAPGYHEDQQGRPFVGPAGKLLDELLGQAGIRRTDVFITNVVKCRPPNNRDPLPAEIEACSKYLDQQIELLAPRVIITLGRYSLAKFVPNETISKAHAKPRAWNGRMVFPMYHPAAALHNEGLRKYLFEDIKRLPEVVEAARKQGPQESGQGPKQLSLL